MSSPVHRRSRTPAGSHSPHALRVEKSTAGWSRENGDTTQSSVSRNRTRSRSHRDLSQGRNSTPDHAHTRRSAKIVIEKLTKNVNENHLQEIFGLYGDIEELEMPTNRQFMMNKGIAYILYADADHAADAIAHMHEGQLDGAAISVSIVLPRRRFSRSPPAKRPPPNRFGEPHRFRDGHPRRNESPDRARIGRSGPMRPSPPRPGDRGMHVSAYHDNRQIRGNTFHRDPYDIRQEYSDRSLSPRRSFGSARGVYLQHQNRDARGRTRSRSPNWGR